MSKLLQWLERLAGGGPEGPKRIRTLQWLLVVGCVGIGLMIVSSFLDAKPVDSIEQNRASPLPEDQEVFLGSGKQPTTVFEPIESELEERVKDVLEQLVGVGRLDVMITVESTEETVVYRNTRESQQVTQEQDRNGATRHITETSRDGEIVLHEVTGSEQPIVLKTIKPKVRGVVIVAEGAENATVRRMITEAVRRGLDVGAQDISVLPRKQRE